MKKLYNNYSKNINLIKNELLNREDLIARELDREKDLIVAVQPTRGLDVGAIEYIHSQLVEQRDAGKARAGRRGGARA